LTAALLVAAAVMTNVAFTVLGIIVNYPDLSKEPVQEMFAAFHVSPGAVTLWFILMALSAALFTPSPSVSGGYPHTQ
jgi:hypothetical protein